MFFFFSSRRRHTRLQGDWSSDVCSSDLASRQQRGVALFVVIIFVMLSMLLALWASRTSLFNELVVGNDADYQRAYEAAQALLQDAELDIRGEKADGTVCTGQDNVCRTSTTAKIPLETQEIAPLLSSLGTGCSQGLCGKRGDKQDFWNNSDERLGLTLAQLTTAGVGARYRSEERRVGKECRSRWSPYH